MASLDKLETAINRLNRSDPTTFDTLIAAFSALGYALSARALLLLTLVGAFVLALRAETAMGLMVLIAYCAATVVPVVVLEIRKRGADQ